MQKSDYQDIKVYRHHYMAILYSHDDKSLTAVGESIGKTVPAGHKELALLIEAGKQRREELDSKIEAN